MQVIEGGVNAIDYLLYPSFNPINLQYFQNSIQNASNLLANTATSFVERAQQVYNQFNSSSAMQAARNIIRQVNNTYVNRDGIYPITNVDEFRSASLTMQRWIMANPVVRGLYNEQRCDGYSNTYVDVHSGDKPTLHYDYCLATDGAIFDSEDGGWECRNYYGDILPEDRELTLMEKVDILNTWEFLEEIIKQGKDDPTDISGGSL